MQPIRDQVDLITARLAALKPAPGRRLVALSGPPGSGKSTLADGIVGRLSAQGRRAAVLPMDGFHLDNRILEARGIVGGKGAPESFDADGFVSLIRRLHGGDAVIFPIFDRDRDLALAGAGEIAPDTEIVIVEGNYLLFDAAPWNVLPSMWDLSVRLNVPQVELRARLIKRWLGQGFSRAAATRRAEQNDLRNAELVARHAIEADMVLD